MLAAPGCGPGERPAPDAWAPAWSEVRELVPEPAALERGEPGRLCGRALGELRAARPRLLPAPTDVLDAAAEHWLRFAESMLLECPLRGGEHAGFAAGYAQLDRLAAEVDAALAFERTRPRGPAPGPG